MPKIKYNDGYTVGLNLFIGIEASGVMSMNSPGVELHIVDSVDMSHIIVKRNGDAEEGAYRCEGVIKPAVKTEHYGDVNDPLCIDAYDYDVFNKGTLGDPAYSKQKYDHLITSTLKFHGFVKCNKAINVGKGWVKKSDLVLAIRYLCDKFKDDNASENASSQKSKNIGLTISTPKPTTSWAFSHNFASSVVHVGLAPPANQKQYKEYLETAAAMEQYMEKFGVKSLLEDSDEMNEMVKTQCSTATDTIDKNMVIKNDPAGPMFKQAMSMFPMFGQIFRYMDMLKTFESIYTERNPIAITFIDTICALNSRVMEPEDFKSFSDQFCCHFLAVCLCSGTLNERGQPYDPDWMLDKISKEPCNSPNNPYRFTIGEDVRAYGRHPEKPPGCLRSDDCEGWMVKICAAYKGIKELCRIYNPKKAIACLLACLDHRLTNEVSNEHKVMTIEFMLRCSQLIKEGRIEFHNPLGGASAAAASQTFNADTVNPEQNEGGHSWSALAYREKATDAQPSVFYLMEGTSAVQEVNYKTATDVDMNVLAKGETVDFLKQVGYQATGMKGELTELHKMLPLEKALQMAEMTPLMAPLTRTHSRAEITFAPWKSHFTSKNAGFYRRMYFTRDCVVGYRNDEGELEFGQYFPSLNNDLSKVVFLKASAKPYDGEQNRLLAAKLNIFKYRRMKEIEMPFVSHEKILDNVSSVWAPIRVLGKPSFVKEAILAASVNNGMMRGHLEVPIDGDKKMHVAARYHSVNISDSFESADEAMKHWDDVEGMCNSANARFEASETGHRITPWLFESCIIRTFYLHVPDLSKEKVVQLP